MADKIEQNDLESQGLMGPIVGMCSFLGTGTTRIKIIEGGRHPRMRLNPLAGASGSLCVATTGGAGAHISIEHDDGRDAATQVTGNDTLNTWYDFSLTTTKDDDIFEADEDVYALPGSAAGNAADACLVMAQFIAVKEEE